MANPDEADAAIEALHHFKLHGFTINVEVRSNPADCLLSLLRKASLISLSL